jgi:carboxyl-terminal processing protease
MRHSSPSKAGLASCLALAVILAASPAAMGAPAGFNAPLFKIALDFEFDDGATTFNEVKTLLLERYYSAQLAESALYWAAIKGMLRHVSPPKIPEQGRIWTEAEYQLVLQGLSGKRTSIGIHSRFNRGDASLTVTAVTQGSPADGVLEVHDRIMRINGDGMTGMDASAIDNLLQAPAGESLSLTIVRDIQVFNATIVSADHNTPILEAGILPNNIAYLRIRSITGGIADRVREHLEAWRGKDIDRLVIDLRNNGGGVFVEGLRLAELFTPKDAVLLYTVRERDGIKRYISTNSGPFAMHVALLVNGSTASAAEAMAAALVGNQKARMVGVGSFGKATMERTFTLKNEMRVRFIIGAMYTPQGLTWNERGLSPGLNIVADTKEAQRWLQLPLTQRFAVDRQLRGAWQLLRE